MSDNNNDHHKNEVGKVNIPKSRPQEFAREKPGTFPFHLGSVKSTFTPTVKRLFRLFTMTNYVIKYRPSINKRTKRKEY